MDRIYESIIEILKSGEPLVVALLFCFLVAIGFALGKGVKHTHKVIHTKWQRNKAARTQDLLQ